MTLEELNTGKGRHVDPIQVMVVGSISAGL